MLDILAQLTVSVNHLMPLISSGSDSHAGMQGLYPTLIVVLVCVQRTQQDDIERLERSMHGHGRWDGARRSCLTDIVFVASQTQTQSIGGGGLQGGGVTLEVGEEEGRKVEKTGGGWSQR